MDEKRNEIILFENQGVKLEEQNQIQRKTNKIFWMFVIWILYQRTFFLRIPKPFYTIRVLYIIWLFGRNLVQYWYRPLSI